VGKEALMWKNDIPMGSMLENCVLNVATNIVIIDVKHFIGIIGKEGSNYVRDVSLL